MLRLPRNLHFEAHKVLPLPRNMHFEVHQVLRLPRNLHVEVHKVLRLPRNLHFEVHKVLRLPRNLHFEVHQVLCLPRNLHFEVHQVLQLPRNLHFEVHQVLAPATKSALRGSQSAVTCHAICTSRFTKCCTCHEICTSRFTRVLHLPRNLHFEVHQVLHLPRNLHFEVHKVLPLPRNLHFEVHKVLHACHEICTSRVTECCACHEICKRITCPKVTIHMHLSRNLSSSTITTMSKVLHLPRKLHFQVKQLRSLAPVTKSRLWYQNAHGTTTRAQSPEAPASDSATQILRACAVEMHIDDVERHECTVNSNELAVHAGPLQRSKHQLLFPYRKNPSVCPHCLGTKINYTKNQQCW